MLVWIPTLGPLQNFNTFKFSTGDERKNRTQNKGSKHKGPQDRADVIPLYKINDILSRIHAVRAFCPTRKI